MLPKLGLFSGPVGQKFSGIVPFGYRTDANPDSLRACANDRSPLVAHDEEQAVLRRMLALRDYRNFEKLSVLGGESADQFDVLVAPSGPGHGRHLDVDGGAPASNGKQGDELNIYYTPAPRLVIKRKSDPQSGEGLVDLAYDDYRFLIEFDDIERARLKPSS